MYHSNTHALVRRAMDVFFLSLALLIACYSRFLSRHSHTHGLGTYFHVIVVTISTPKCGSGNDIGLGHDTQEHRSIFSSFFFYLSIYLFLLLLLYFFFMCLFDKVSFYLRFTTLGSFEVR